MVRTFLKVYMELGSYFLFLQEQIKDIIIIMKRTGSIHWNVRIAQGHHKGAETATNVPYDSKTKPEIPYDSRKPQVHDYFWQPRIFGFLATPGTEGIRRSKGTAEGHR
jgi:hypothetical protein